MQAIPLHIPTGPDGVDYAAFLRATLPRQPQLVRMPDTSHFFHRKLIDLRGAVKNGVRDWLPVPPAA